MCRSAALFVMVVDNGTAIALTVLEYVPIASQNVRVISGALFQSSILPAFLNFRRGSLLDGYPCRIGCDLTSPHNFPEKKICLGRSSAFRSISLGPSPIEVKRSQTVSRLRWAEMFANTHRVQSSNEL